MPDLSDISSTTAKTEARATALAARRALPAEVRQQAAVRVQAALLDLVRTQRPRLIACYAPMPGEPGGADLPDVLAAHARLLLPVLLPDLDLDWAEYAGPGSLTPGPLREPTGPRLGKATVADADLVVVPALAVDRTGLRLGRGGGSYDRALARVRPAALVVALLYDDERVEALPAEPHDTRVHAVVRPTTGVDWTDGGRMAHY